MPRGDKSSYTGKQKRQAEHIEEGYEQRGVPDKEAERRAWATVNKQDHGGKKSGSGVCKPKDTSSSHKGGRLGGRCRRQPSRFRAIGICQESCRHTAQANGELDYDGDRAVLFYPRGRGFAGASLGHKLPAGSDGARTGCSILRADKLKGSQLGLGPGA